MPVSDPSIVDQLRSAAEACEKSAAEQMDLARKYRAALALFTGEAPPAPSFYPSVPGVYGPFPVGPAVDPFGQPIPIWSPPVHVTAGTSTQPVLCPGGPLHSYA